MGAQEPTGEARRLIETMLDHAGQLSSASSTSTQRELLLQIRQATDALLALLDPSDTATVAETPPHSDSAAAPAAEITRHVLLVEDNPFTQKLMTRLLTQQGYRVTLAQHGREALEHLNQDAPDLILMDLRMPVMDGFQATAAIREQEALGGKSRTPIIAVTALVAEEEQNHAMEVGMDGYHAKPVRAAILFAEMERLLHAHPPAAAPLIVDPEEGKMIVDLDRLIKTVDGDQDLLREITELYFTDAPRQMRRIEQAIAAGNAQEVREAAHSLKGATGAFGRIHVYDLALALEHAGQKNELQLAVELWNQLTVALRVMEETIKKEIALLSGESS
ncbi:MAG: response regulator [Magnetococcales bacterium]|nr:response regulator [Magnetococcales bacterium]